MPQDKVVVATSTDAATAKKPAAATEPPETSAEPTVEAVDSAQPVAAVVDPALVATAAKQDAPAEHEMTLTQFGIEVSRKEKRVELLHAFIWTEKRAGNFKDTKTNYLARFADFANQPV